jgi:hypothetical protein
LGGKAVASLDLPQIHALKRLFYHRMIKGSSLAFESQHEVSDEFNEMQTTVSHFVIK